MFISSTPNTLTGLRILALEIAKEKIHYSDAKGLLIETDKIFGYLKQDFKEQSSEPKK
jgi:hypothetical protein